MTKKYFVLFGNCIPVKGVMRSTICDLQRNDFVFIPNEICDLFASVNSIKVKDVNDEIFEGLDYLAAEGYGFFSESDHNRYPFVSLGDGDFSQEINTIIIDLNHQSSYSIIKLAEEIHQLRITSIEVRCFSDFSTNKITRLLNQLDRSHVRTIHLALKFSKSIDYKSFIDREVSRHNSIKQIVIHSSERSALEHLFDTKIIFTKEIISDASHCGNITPLYFYSTVEMGNLKDVNNCLKGKLGVDVHGNIKNCPSLTEAFGKIDQTSLAEAVTKKEFKKYQQISKVDIHECRDCEFRLICTDCRAYRETESIFSKPKKCNYDPYTNQWAN